MMLTLTITAPQDAHKRLVLQVATCTCMAVKFFPIPTIYFVSWGVTRS